MFRSVRLLPIAIGSFLFAPSLVHAGVCDLTWTGDQLVEKIHQFVGAP